MNIYIHELIHFILSILVGVIIWKKWCMHIGIFIVALIGGFFIDFDHLFDYFLAFDTKFNLSYFLNGYQFLKNDKIYIFFHAWEWVIITFFIFLFVNFIFKNKKVQLLSFCMLAFSFSLFLHLLIDITTNDMQTKSYFLLYRTNNNFDLMPMVTEKHYQKHILNKKIIKLNSLGN